MAKPRTRLARSLDRLVAAVVDGKTVDWESEYRARPESSRFLDQLRAIESVAFVVRGDASTPAAPAPEPPPRRIGHYAIEGLLGRGGMGVVYLARDTRLGRLVAIKSLPDELGADPGRWMRFEREARILASLDHPNIAIVFGLELDENGVRHLVMERLEGQALSTRLARGPLGLEESLRIGVAVASALEAAHARGVIHRDLKPGNVVVGSSGVAKVLDFGLAKHVGRISPTGSDDGRVTSFVSGVTTRVGTPGYMSPEQITGAAQDERTDTFAFGCLLFECLTGRRAFTGSGAAEILAATLAADPAWDAFPPECPRAVRALVKRSLARDPAARDRMADVRRELEREAGQLASRHIVAAGATRDAGGGDAPLVRGLPRETSSFVGRDRELSHVLELLESSRLVTVSGIGGGGKTRLAVRVVAHWVREQAQPGFFIDLVSHSPGLPVASSLASVLDVREQPGVAIEDTVLAALGSGPALVVLDNCETVPEGVAALARTLLARSDVRILATSRSALAVPGERVYALPPLSVPAAGRAAPPAELERSEAVQLFVARARQVDPGLALDAETAGAIAELCVRLDGIPLALELAAARVRVLSPREIAARLDERFRLLRETGEQHPARHRRLEAVIAWSFEHAPEEEQAIVRALSVFQGGATLDALCAALADADEFAVLEGLTHLAERALVTADRGGAGETRYRMLETVREHALHELAAAGEEEAARNRHLLYFDHLVEVAFDGLAGDDEARWVARLLADEANLLAALAWCDRAPDGVAIALRTASRLGRFWYVRGDLTRGGAELDRALRRPGAEARTRERAGSLYAAGDLAVFRGDLVRAREAFEEALDIYRALDDRPGVMRSVFGLGNALSETGDVASARVRFEEALVMARELKSGRGEAVVLGNLSVLAERVGDFALAKERSEAALAILREGSDRHALALTLSNLTSYTLRAGQASAARERSREALELLRALGATRGMVYGLETAAEVVAHGGDTACATRLLAAAVRLRLEIGMVHAPQDQSALDARLAQARESLGPQEFDRHWQAGQTLGAASAIDEALGWLATAP